MTASTQDAKGESGMRPLYLKGKEGSKDLVCYVPGGVYWGAYGRITGPDSGWIDARDLTLCKRINNETRFGVYCRAYDVKGSYDARLRFYKPYNWIRNIYTFAQTNGYENLHLVGFSGGGSLASSQLLYYPDQMVRSLVVISGPVANSPVAVHVNAAYYADQITTRSLLVYGKDDGYRSHADLWRRNNPAAILREYAGGHDFHQANKLDWVVKQVIDWEKKKAVPVTIKHRRKRKKPQWLKLA